MRQVSAASMTYLALCGLCLICAAEPACRLGELRTDSTPYSISIEWDLVGDSDHDGTCQVQYRRQGADRWRAALRLFHVDHQWWYHTMARESNRAFGYDMRAWRVCNAGPFLPDALYPRIREALHSAATVWPR